jgi:hypothetical protein
LVYLEGLVEEVKASLGAIRQDVRSVLAHIGRGELGVDSSESEKPTEEELKEFLLKWREKADEAWQKQLSDRRSKLGLATGDEVTLEDEQAYLEGWAR